MRLAAGLPPGVAALLFEAARGRRRLERACEEAFEAAGYREMVLPVLDYAEPYEALLPLAQRQGLYRFVDREGALLALRSDFTPMVARLLAPRLATLELPLRLFYRGDVVRSDLGAAGRRHEFYQVGIELLGADSEIGDEEVLSLAARLLTQSETPEPQLVLGAAGLLDELLLAVGGDGAAALAERVSRRERAVAAASPELGWIAAHGTPTDAAALGAEPAARLVRLQDMASRLAKDFPTLRVAIDLAEFALFSAHPAFTAQDGSAGYYDGFVFRAFAGRRARPVGAGGRYDRFFDRLGARLPAAGFSFALDALAAEPREEM